jgi:hypothetical protein
MTEGWQRKGTGAVNICKEPLPFVFLWKQETRVRRKKRDATTNTKGSGREKVKEKGTK